MYDLHSVQITVCSLNAILNMVHEDSYITLKGSIYMQYSEKKGIFIGLFILLLSNF